MRQNNRVRVEWEKVFNDGQDCAEVDFIIMIYPKNEPSAVCSYFLYYLSSNNYIYQHLHRYVASFRLSVERVFQCNTYL